MALPAQSSPLTLSSQESDYGSHSTGADSLTLRAPISTKRVHPVENSERTYNERQEQLQYQLASKSFGLGFAMHMKHQRAATSVPGLGHLPGVLPSSNAMFDALTGRDVDMDFADTLGQDLFSRHSPHEIMEHKLSGRMF